jgi:ABC-type glutathione transport system ATPase component
VRLCTVTHFSADRVIFMDEGVIVEQGVPAQVIGSPQHARTRTFLQRILNPAAANLGEVPDTGPAPRIDRERAPEIPHPTGRAPDPATQPHG